MWKKIRPILLAAKLDPVRVENPICPGTPDVNLCDGRWLELKCIPAWPKRASSRVTIRHYTPQQRVWLYRRWTHAPGSTLLLLNVLAARQWLLFDGDVAARSVGRVNAADHRERARAILSEQDLAELPKIIAEKTRGSDLGPVSVCTGSLVHDEFTPCPVHDARLMR